MDSVKKAKPGSSQWCPMKGQEKPGTNCNTDAPSKHQGTVSRCDSD